MPTKEICLGHAELSCREAGLRVQLESTAQFAASEEDDLAQLQRALTTAIPTDQKSAKGWIHCTNTFELVLSLRTDSVLTASERDILGGRLADHIQHAKMWQQLHLVPASVRTTFNDTSKMLTISTRLAYVPVGQPLKRQLHKLGSEVPAHHVQPPDGIVQIACEDVNITLSVSTFQHRGRKRPKLDADVVDSADYRPDDCIPDYHLQVDEDEDEDFFDIAEGHCTEGYEYPTTAFGEDWMFEDESDDFQARDLTLLFDDALLEAENQTVSAALSRSGEQDAYRRSSIDHSATSCNDKEQCCVDGCVEIIEAAIQYAICGVSCLPGKDLRVAKENALSPLAAVIPSIWLPDYLSSIANRAIFIPTVAHALASVLDESKNQASTACSVPKIAGPPEPNVSASRESPQCGATLPARLWTHLQVSLCQAAASRKLCLLSEPATERVRVDDQQVFDELLGFGDTCGDRTYGIDVGGVIDTEDLLPVVGDGSMLLDDGCDLFLDEDEEDLAYKLYPDDLADRPDPGSDLFLDDVEPRLSYQGPGFAGVIRSFSPDGRLDPAKAEATVTWQGGESKLKVSLSQNHGMPSHADVGSVDFTPRRKTKRSLSG